MADAMQVTWVTRVLGVAATASVHAPGAVLPLWIAAREEVDAGIDKLQLALRDDGDAYLRSIAEFGLNGATNRRSVALMVALREVEAKPSDETRETALEAVDAFRDFLDAAPIVDLIEDNPFGVAVPMRATLGKALDAITSRLGA